MLRSSRITYLLLTKFEGRTVSYGPSFFRLRFMAQARFGRAINRRGKKRGSVTYNRDRENGVSEIFIINLQNTSRKVLK